MKRLTWLLTSAVIWTACATAAQTPVLLELFTSEGCSSCPPADQLLAQLEARQPYSGVEVIALSEHVDYWNHGGWRDPYSSPLFSQRQIDYAQRLGVPDVYTPQVVVDGQWEGVGSDGAKLAANVQRASRKQKAQLSLELVNRTDNTLRLHAKTDSPFPTSARLFIAVVADHEETHVKGGENSGRHLVHTAVAQQIASFDAQAAAHDLEIKVSALPERWHLVGFVQSKGGAVSALASLPMPASVSQVRAPR